MVHFCPDPPTIFLTTEQLPGESLFNYNNRVQEERNYRRYFMNKRSNDCVNANSGMCYLEKLPVVDSFDSEEEDLDFFFQKYLIPKSCN